MRSKWRYPGAPETCWLWGKGKIAMLTKLFFPTVTGVRVERARWQGQALHLDAATTRRAARCPLCGHRSTRVHSFYSAHDRRPALYGRTADHPRAHPSVCLPGARVRAQDLHRAAARPGRPVGTTHGTPARGARTHGLRPGWSAHNPAHRETKPATLAVKAAREE